MSSPLHETAVVLINTGSPDAPEEEAVRRYLAEFLSDRRVIELPPWKWWPILHGIILRRRPARSAKRYQGVWLPEGSPLIVHTRRTAEGLSRRFPGVAVRWAMRYGNPSVEEVLSDLVQKGVRRMAVLPLFAQYTPQTTGACFDAVFEALGKCREMPSLRIVRDYAEDPAYIEALKNRIESYWSAHGAPMSVGGRLLLSFHGVPQAGIDRGDTYEASCRKTAALLARALGLSEGDWALSFQSRFGRDEWVKPYTLPWVQEAARSGLRRLDVMCPGFAADCLETIEEIGDELRRAYLGALPGEAPGEFHYIPALNDSDGALGLYEAILRRELAGWA